MILNLQKMQLGSASFNLLLLLMPLLIPPFYNHYTIY